MCVRVYVCDPILLAYAACMTNSMDLTLVIMYRYHCQLTKTRLITHQKWWNLGFKSILKLLELIRAHVYTN